MDAQHSSSQLALPYPVSSPHNCGPLSDGGRAPPREGSETCSIDRAHRPETRGRTKRTVTSSCWDLASRRRSSAEGKLLC